MKHCIIPGPKGLFDQQNMKRIFWIIFLAILIICLFNEIYIYPFLLKNVVYIFKSDQLEYRNNVIQYKNSAHLIEKYQVPEAGSISSSKMFNKTKSILLASNLLPWKRSVYKDYKCAAICSIISEVSDSRQADAIIFPPRIMLKSERKITFPKYRQPEQFWVLYVIDRVSNIPFWRMKQKLDVFNLTMTWRPDSDVELGYGYLEKLHTSVTTNSIPSTLAHKTGLVAWVVSHCHTESLREMYVKALKKHIPVDIYGRCGKLPCSRESNSSCHSKIGKTYKFYLAFENSICSGYVTEKLFRTLEMNIVPVVFGGAVYKNLLPQKSYIDVLDFSSPKELAQYLKKLDNEDDLYLKYFDWKRKYKVHDVKDSINRAICQLCQILHDPWYPHQEYKDVEMWMQNGCDNQLHYRLQRNSNY